MKEFAIYTASRLLLLLLALALLAGLRILLEPVVLVPWFAVLAVAILASSVASWFLLRRQRDRVALRVQAGAEKASARLEASRSKEDVD